jgi:single-stranded-DNA-specific exonuclease
MLADTCGLAPLVARVLAARGFCAPAEVEDFLHPSLVRDWSDPTLICGMTEVADALETAIRARKRILVFGDFDVDGISATALMLRGLAALGACADFLIPNRMDDGYGLTVGVLDRVYEKNPELVITVDCGISSGVEVAALVARGIEVLVTDHHEPADTVPVDIPVADPKLKKDSSHTQLAGVGVALKLIAALGTRFGKPTLWHDLVDLATLGTIADIMPLTGENRSLVAEGLRLLTGSPRPGIASVLALSQRNSKDLRATDLSFTLIPRLNAAGRMGNPDKALELLVNDDPVQAFETAAALDAANNERRSVESALFDEALAQAEQGYHGQKILIVAGEDWHEGVRGIVASRLVSRFGVPAIVFSLIGAEARGSGRSIGAVNLFKAAQQCADCALRFGGHEAAIGITVPTERLEEFRACMEAVMDKEPEENFHPPLLVDAQLELAALRLEAVEQLKSLEPHGHANREPLFVTCDVLLKNTRAVGAKKNHLSFTVTDGRNNMQAIWFQCSHIQDFLAFDGPVDVIYQPQVDEWNGQRRVQLMVNEICKTKDAEESAPAAACLPAKGTVVTLETAMASDTPDTPVASVAADAASATHPLRTNAPSIEDVAREIIGEAAVLHDSQVEALRALEVGESVLAVMATGRGKSLIFQVHAARLALSAKQASVFIYPLRALIADQYVHLAASFARLGLVAKAVTGENTTEEKDQLFQGLYEGRTDVLLTTPEFFHIHAWRFAQSSRIGFVVFDEAHHIQTERSSDREAYHDLAVLRSELPNAQYLAVTATADDRITAGIRAALDITRVIVDDTRRENLLVDDARAVRDRDLYLVSLVERAEKTIIYVNSRAQAIVVTRLLRKHASNEAESIAFYHAGLTRTDRRALEEGFRSGTLRCMISTSAFGEGVNIPGIAHVILYHLPFSLVAFNQMSGRAGRNGQPATIHLLFTEQDAQLNRQILAPLAPARDELATLYRVLRQQSEQGNGSVFVASFEPLVQACQARDSRCRLGEEGIANGLAIFEELGLLTVEDAGIEQRITLIPSASRVELCASSRYLEGVEELALFERFRMWVLAASGEVLRAQIISPLAPSGREV